MPNYSNGYIPGNLLITFNVGYSAGEGLWKHQLSPATYSKHLALVALARKKTGRTLALSSGWSGYRPYSAQVYARGRYGNGAATPGTSSHGGFWERRQTLAIDYGNWGYVYNWDRDAFYRDVRAVGLVPGLISVPRGYPDEPWHVVDLDPWAAVPAGGNTTEPTPAQLPEILKELEDMNQAKLIHKVVGGVKTLALVCALYPGGSRTTREQVTANAWATVYGNSISKTPEQFDLILAEMKALNEAWVAQQKAIHG